MRTTHLLAIFALAVGGPALAELPEQIDALCQPYVDSQTVGGMTVGVIKGDQAFVRGYGQLSADKSTKPDGQTIYEIGSVSKVFTGLLLAEAVIDSRVSLVTPAEDLLPKGVTMNRRHESLPIRLWHLSTHTSGLPRLPDNLSENWDVNDPYASYSGKQLAKFLGDYQPRKRPGEEHAYSNLATGLLGDLLARDQETDYESLLHRKILKPLELSDTGITLNDEQRKRLAPPHVDGGGAGHTWNFERLAGCGAIKSTVEDLLQLARACLNPPESDLGQAIELSWMVHQEPLNKGDFAMGLGWFVAHDGSTRWHNGETGGYHAAIFVSRPLKTVAVVLTNTATMEVDQLAEQIMRSLAGADEKPRRFEKVLEIAPEIVARYEGEYVLAPGVSFKVTMKGSKLFVGLTGQPTFRVYPRSETEWFYKVVEATLTFQVDGSGRCTGVELFQGGVRQQAKRVR